MDGKTVTIKIESVAGKSNGAKRVLDDLEKDVLASGRRVAANARQTDRVVAESKKASVRSMEADVRRLEAAEKRAARESANSFLASLKQKEAAARSSATGMRSAMESAFGSSAIGGFVGGFAGSIVAGFASQVAQLPSILKTQLDIAVKIAAERQNALKGLESIATFKGISSAAVQETVKSLRLVRAGIIDIGEASTAMKNLLSSNFTLEESRTLLERFSDTAAFGKSAALGFGEAVRSATEGVRNGNSILVDNVGLTKDLSQILKEAGYSEQDLSKATSDANIRRALYNGLLKESNAQVGDADKLTQGWTGNTAALTTAQNNLYAAIGRIIINNADLAASIRTITGTINDMITGFDNADDSGTRAVNSLTSKFASFAVDATVSIRKMVFEVEQLVGTIEAAARGVAYLTAVLSNPGAAIQDALMPSWAFDPNRAADPWRNERDVNLREMRRAWGAVQNRGREFESFERRTRQNFADNLLRNRPGFSLAPPSALGSTMAPRPNITIDKANPLYFGEGGTYRPPVDAPTAPAKPGRPGAKAQTTKSDLPEFGSLRQLVISSGNPQWDYWFNQMGSRFGVDPNVLLLQVGQESSFNRTAVSPKGARGFSQFMPATAKRFGVNVNSVQDSIRGQAQYMAELLSMFGGDYSKALAGYNAGEGAVMRYGGIPPFRETKHYVAKIRSRYAGRVRKGGAYGTFEYPDESDGTVAMADTALGGARDLNFAAREKEIDQNRALIDIYGELAEKVFNLTERTKEETFWFDYKLGRYPQLNDETARQVAETYRLIDATEKKKKADEDAAEAKKKADDKALDDLEKYRREQERAFDETAGYFEDKLDTLFRGGFKDLWKSILDDMRQNFVRQMAQLLAQAFSGSGIGGQNGQSGGILSGLMKRLFGGGGTGAGGFGVPGMGPGGTPMFNGGSGGGFGSFFGNFFGGGMSAPRTGDIVNLPGVGDAMQVNAGGAGGLSSLAGLAATAGPQAAFALWPMAIKEGLTTRNKWKAFAWLGAVGFISALFRRDNATKKLKEAALSTYGITVKDKQVLNTLKQLGETMFGKGKVGPNAQAVVSSDQGQLILRNYAEATGQSTKGIDKLYVGDENWKGNDFRSRFGGFRAMGGPVKAGLSYVVGERRAELFTPRTDGHISPTVGDPKMIERMMVVLGQLEETQHALATRLESMRPGDVVTLGAGEAGGAIYNAYEAQHQAGGRASEQADRNHGRRYY